MIQLNQLLTLQIVKTNDSIMSMALRTKILVIISISITILIGCNKLSNEGKERFREAIVRNEIKYIRYILSKDLDLNDEKLFGYLPLHIAVEADNIEIIKLFLDHGADINAVDGMKQNCLFKTYNIETAKYLIEHGANVNQIDEYGAIPLFNVTWYYDLAKLYIEKGTNIYHKDKEGDGVLFYALMNDNYELIKYIIKIDNKIINFIDNVGYNSLIWYSATGFGNVNIADLLIRHGIDVNYSNYKGINSLIANILNRKCNRSVYGGKIYNLNQNIKYINYLINKGININHIDIKSNTALHYAVVLNREKELIKLLLDNGAKVDIKNIQGKTPIDIAIEKGRKDIVDLLKKYAK